MGYIFAQACKSGNLPMVQASFSYLDEYDKQEIKYGFALACFHSKLKVVKILLNSLINTENYGIVLATHEIQEYIAKHKGLNKEDLLTTAKHETQKQLKLYRLNDKIVDLLEEKYAVINV